jgi:predicted dehydrogenase
MFALERGKAVLCEKPFALNAQDAKRVVDLAREKQVFCMEAMRMRFNPLVQQLRALVMAGTFGEVQILRAELGWPKEAERMEQPELGRGALYDFGVYPISLAHYLFGVPHDVKVAARRHASGVDESVSALLLYQGCTAMISASVRVLLANDALIAGSAGSAWLRKPFLEPSSLAIHESRRETSLGGRLISRLGQLISLPRIPRDIGLRREAEEVMHCLHQGKLESAVMPLSETLQVLECVDKIRSYSAADRCAEP